MNTIQKAIVAALIAAAMFVGAAPAFAKVEGPGGITRISTSQSVNW